MITRFIFYFLVFFPLQALSSDYYKSLPGPHYVEVSKINITNADGRVLPLRVSYPKTGMNLPLVVLSHGGGCPGGSYKSVGDHWSSHGYAVIQPTHEDSISTGFNMEDVNPRQMEGIIRLRVEDMSIILDNLQKIENSIPLLSARIDSLSIIAAGHSMGAATAMLATGLTLQNPFSKSLISSKENRYKALILLSEPGGNPTLPDEPWRYVSLPTLIYTGTDDFGSESGENSRIPFEYKIVNNFPNPSPQKYYLWINKIDHFLGGLWCRDNGKDPDIEGLSIVKSVTTAFLDSFARGYEKAMVFLNDSELLKSQSYRARLSIK